MSDKQKNLIIRSISGVIFLAIMIVGMVFRPDAFIFLFTLITGMTIWEYTGLVNELEDVTINRFISTIAGMYLFLAVAAIRTGYVDNFIVFVPYILSIVYLFVSELYTKNLIPCWHRCISPCHSHSSTYWLSRFHPMEPCINSISCCH